MNNIELNILQVKQPIGTFYSTVIQSETLYSLSKADVIRIEKENEDFELGPYVGKQRPLDERKLTNIQKYLMSATSTFPNSIIVSLNEKYLVSLEENKIVVEDNEEVFSILDGQHRLEGLHRAKLNIDVVVSIFIGLDEDVQSEVFDTINSEQTKVNRSLTVYKQSLSSYDTPRKFTSLLSLNFALGDTVWKDKIKIIGKKDEYSEQGMISLLSFNRPLIEMTYNDNDYFLIKRSLELNNNTVSAIKETYDKEKYIFWSYYLNQDIELLFKILNNFFNSLSKVLSEDFANNRSFIQKTTGYNASMMLFKELYLEGFSIGDLSEEFFYKKLQPLSEFNGQLISGNFEASGDGSAKKLFKLFIEAINKHEIV